MFSTHIHVNTLGCLLPRMDGTMMKNISTSAEVEIYLTSSCKTDEMNAPITDPLGAFSWKWTWIGVSEFQRNLGVSKNRGTPRWMVHNGKPYQNWWFGGTTIFGSIHLGGEEKSLMQKKTTLGERKKNLQKTTFTSTFREWNFHQSNWSLSAPNIHSTTQRKPQKSGPRIHMEDAGLESGAFFQEHMLQQC